MPLEIPLSRGMVALVDKEDYERLSKYKWYADKIGSKWYAKRTIIKDCGKRTSMYLHREILGVGVGNVDHIDGNGLNNRRNNLREATKRQNNMNRRPIKTGTSRYKGVSFDRRRKKWLAQIKYKGTNFNLGHYEHEKDAAQMYNKKAIELFGEFAYLNEIEGGCI